MLGWFPLLPPPPPPRHRPSSLPTTELKPTRCPSPLLRDVGPPPSLDGGKHEGKEDTKGGTHEMGGPGGTSWRATTFVVASFLPFYIPHRHWPPLLTSTATRTPRRAECQHSGPNDNTASESTTPQANRRHRERIDETASESKTPRANRRDRNRAEPPGSALF